MADAYRRLYGQTKNAQNADEAINLYKRAKELFIRDGYQGLKIIHFENFRAKKVIFKKRKSRAACSRVNIESACLLAVPGHKLIEAGHIFESEALFSCNEKLLKYGAKCKNTTNQTH